MRHKAILLVIAGVFLSGCGETPARLGVLVDELRVVKANSGPSPAGLAQRGFVPGTLVRMKQADLLGDDALEVVVEMPRLAGVEIRDQSGTPLAQIETPDYLTDFGTIRSPGAAKSDIVLYTYPNQNGGGTFVVMNAAKQERARWQEYPPAGRFTVATWRGQPALFYLLEDTLIVRSARGEVLTRLAAPDGRTFRDVQTLERSAGRLAVVASGNGYTPYHMVLIYDAAGRLVFREVSNEHAFELKADGDSAFVVSTQTTQWKYTPPP